jgi:hypothetical protein
MEASRNGNVGNGNGAVGGGSGSGGGGAYGQVKLRSSPKKTPSMKRLEEKNSEDAKAQAIATATARGGANSAPPFSPPKNEQRQQQQLRTLSQQQRSFGEDFSLGQQLGSGSYSTVC